MNMQHQINLALLQITPTGTQNGNLLKGIQACRDAARMGADLALFPEMWSIGYDIYDRPFEQWVQDALSPDCSSPHFLVTTTFLCSFSSRCSMFHQRCFTILSLFPSAY